MGLFDRIKKTIKPDGKPPLHLRSPHMELYLNKDKIDFGIEDSTTSLAQVNGDMREAPFNMQKFISANFIGIEWDETRRCWWILNSSDLIVRLYGVFDVYANRYIPDDAFEVVDAAGNIQRFHVDRSFDVETALNLRIKEYIEGARTIARIDISPHM